MAEQLYRVRVYERPYVYENVKAASPAAAEAQIVRLHWAGDYGDIERIDVAPQRKKILKLDQPLHDARAVARREDRQPTIPHRRPRRREKFNRNERVSLLHPES